MNRLMFLFVALLFAAFSVSADIKGLVDTDTGLSVDPATQAELDASVSMINTTVVTGDAVDNSTLVGTGVSAAGFVTLPSCSDEAETLGFNTTTGAWVCNVDAGAGGGMTSWTLDGDTGTSQSISDAQTASILGDTGGIDTVVGATDTVTVSYDATEAASANEGAMVLQNIGGAVIDSQVPDDITIDLATLATTATTANAGDSATAFFSAGTIEDARVAATIARDSEITTDIATHAAIADAHFTHATSLASLNTQIGTSLADGPHTTDTTCSTVACTVGVDDTVTFEGGTTLTSLADDEVLVGTGAAAGAYTALQNCTDGTESLDWNGTAFVCNTITGGSASNSFETHSTPAGTAPVADGATDTLTWTAGTGVTITGTAASDTINVAYSASGAETANEAVLDLADLQGAVTDGQVPNSITVDLATTATTANAGDSATAFFSSGVVGHERGGLEADVSAYAGLISIAGGATSAVTDLAGLNAAIGSGIVTGAHTVDTSADTICAGTGTYLDGEGGCDALTTFPGFTSLNADYGADVDLATLALPASTTISAFGATLVDDAAAANALTTLGLTATASEINTPLDGASVTLTEFQELETIGSTVIESADWSRMASADQAVTTTDSPTFLAITLAGSATPGMEFSDTDDAAGTATIYGNSSGGTNDIVMTLGVEDSGGEDQGYIELDGVNETVDILQPATAITPAENDNDTSIATTAYVQTEITGLGGGGVDTSGTPVANDFARFTDADTIEGRSYAEVRADLGVVIGTNVQAYNANTTILGATIGASEVDADVATQGELDAVAALVDTDDEIIAIINASPSTQISIAAGGTGAGTAAGAASALGVGIEDSPQFAAVNVGAATDTTITRVSAGVIAVEGVAVQTGTDDDVPEAGDFGAAGDLEADGTISANAVDYAATSGSVKALTPVTDSTGDFAANFTGANLYGGTFVANADDGDLTLPAPIVGMNFTIITMGAIEIVAEPTTGDDLLLDGVQLDDNDSATNTSTAGDIMVCQYYDADGLMCISNGWTDQD